MMRFARQEQSMACCRSFDANEAPTATVLEPLCGSRTEHGMMQKPCG
ncbi:MAG: hypothetical protein K6E82_06595 [Eubacterium sp.]|nr:hypothetical protein [Eubacterium sp.]